MLPKEIQAIVDVLPAEYRKIVEPVFLMYDLRTAHLESEVKQLNDRLAQNSRNSNKPPYSDVFNKPAPKSLRKKTGSKRRGQNGYDGNRQSEVKACVCGHVIKRYRYLQYGSSARSTLLYMHDLQLVAGFGEPYVRIAVCGYWLYWFPTSRHTYFELHSKKGHQAMENMGILPKFEGVAVHDFWKSYFRYSCQHGLCAPHLLRELNFVCDRNKQLWAKELPELLVKMKDAKDQSKVHFSAATKQFIHRCYEELVEKGLADNPLDPCSSKSRDRSKQSKPRNRNYPEEVLRFFYDFKVPFDNNPSERDLRMGKVKQKISCCFRSLEDNMYFACIRSYITTARKQDFNAFYALRDLFEGRTLMLHLVGG